jgi:hypothetical protein
MKTSVEKERIKLSPRVGHYHYLRYGRPTQVDSTSWVAPKNEGVSVTLSGVREYVTCPTRLCMHKCLPGKDHTSPEGCC